jgi:hypothetical protein
MISYNYKSVSISTPKKVFFIMNEFFHFPEGTGYSLSYMTQVAGLKQWINSFMNNENNYSSNSIDALEFHSSFIMIERYGKSFYYSHK